MKFIIQLEVETVKKFTVISMVQYLKRKLGFKLVNVIDIRIEE